MNRINAFDCLSLLSFESRYEKLLSQISHDDSAVISNFAIYFLLSVLFFSFLLFFFCFFFFFFFFLTFIICCFKNVVYYHASVQSYFETSNHLWRRGSNSENAKINV